MTVVTEPRSMMPTNVTRTVRNGRIVTLLRSVETTVGCINAVSGKTIIKDEIEDNFEIFISGEIKYFAMSVDFAALCLFVPIGMEHIFWILQTNL